MTEEEEEEEGQKASKDNQPASQPLPRFNPLPAGLYLWHSLLALVYSDGAAAIGISAYKLAPSHAGASHPQLLCALLNCEAKAKSTSKIAISRRVIIAKTNMPMPPSLSCPSVACRRLAICWRNLH